MAFYKGYARPFNVSAAEIAQKQTDFGVSIYSCIQFFNPYVAAGSDPTPKRFILRRLLYHCVGGITAGALTMGRPGGATSALEGGGVIESSTGAANGLFPWAGFGGGLGSANGVGANGPTLDYGLSMNTEPIPYTGGSPSSPNIVLRKYAYASNAYPAFGQVIALDWDFCSLPSSSFGWIVRLRPGFSFCIRSRAENVPLVVSAYWDLEDYGPAYGNVEVGDP